MMNPSFPAQYVDNSKRDQDKTKFKGFTWF